MEDAVERRLVADATLDETTRRTLIRARRGQGAYRDSVHAIERACRLTGITNPALLIASHIKPWRLCEAASERLDGMNGLMLTPGCLALAPTCCSTAASSPSTTTGAPRCPGGSTGATSCGSASAARRRKCSGCRRRRRRKTGRDVGRDRVCKEVEVAVGAET